MAFLVQFTCGHCKQLCYEVVTNKCICVACRTAIDKADTAAYMDKLAVLPLGERIRRIELALYKLNAESRLGALEVHHVRH